MKAAPKAVSSPKRKAPVRKVSLPAIPTVVEVAEKCGKCKYFLLDQVNKEQGACRRFPATPFFVAGGTVAAFPSMMESGWCGEFKQS